MLERPIHILGSPSLLQQILGFPHKLISAYLDISSWGFAGEIDFVLQSESGNYIVVELERKINSRKSMMESGSSQTKSVTNYLTMV
jgi:hypothetical protein